ncbi:MAG: ROK family protein [Thermodesulfobacteriota bacterium]
MKGYRIGIDLGGTKTEAVLLDPGDEVLVRRRIHTPADEGYAGILESTRSLIAATIREVPARGIVTVGIGIPGTINQRTHLVQNANTTCLIGKAFQFDLEKALGRPVGMENDANCFVLAEALKGAANGYEVVFGVIMGTGCGGGICIQGRVRSGGHGIAGEWGHFAVDPLGEACYCGNRGCVETKISGKGVETRFRNLFGTSLTMRQIVGGYRRGDRHCRDVFQQFLDDFGRCLGGLISILDPDVVVLGGGLSQIDELYTLGRQAVRRYAFHEDLQTPIVKNRLGDSAGVFGAAWIGR